MEIPVFPYILTFIIIFTNGLLRIISFFLPFHDVSMRGQSYHSSILERLK